MRWHERSPFDQTVTQAYGRHLLTKHLDNQEPTGVARLHELGSSLYALAFRRHSRRWPSPPDSGSLAAHPNWLACLSSPIFIHTIIKLI